MKTYRLVERTFLGIHVVVLLHLLTIMMNAPRFAVKANTPYLNFDAFTFTTFSKTGILLKSAYFFIR